MPCYSRLDGWMGRDGQFTMSISDAWADRPMSVPCGKCVGCRERKAREWALRCVHEASMHEHNSFITLTYSPESVPRDGSLRVEDFQRFCKRLRKRVGRFRFYHCGEYGSKNLRPHYHALLFGQDFSADRVQVQARPYPKFVSPLLEEIWGLGRTDIGTVTYNSAAYVARYVHKANAVERETRVADEDEGDPKYLRVDPESGEYWYVKPEYSTMSRNPGIGASWLEKFHGDVYPSDQVVHDGFAYPVPRYYDAKVASFPSSPNEPSFAELVDKAKVERRRNAELRKEDSTRDRLAVRERCAVARLRLRQRDL